MLEFILEDGLSEGQVKEDGSGSNEHEELQCSWEERKSRGRSAGGGHCEAMTSCQVASSSHVSMVAMFPFFHSVLLI